MDTESFKSLNERAKGSVPQARLQDSSGVPQARLQDLSGVPLSSAYNCAGPRKSTSFYNLTIDF